MLRIVIVILIYNHHKPIDSIQLNIYIDVHILILATME
jgi:hypothetical protein